MLWHFINVSLGVALNAFSRDPCFSFVIVEANGDFLQITDCDSRHTHGGQTAPRVLPSVTFVGGTCLNLNISCL